MGQRKRDSQPWYQFIGEVDWLLNDSQFTWATCLLEAMRETVLATRRVEVAQQRLLNIIRERGM